MHFWLVKSEPFVYSWSDLLKDKKTGWEGVRNYAARNNLREMTKGDLVLFYHSMDELRIMGVAKVVRENYQDPSTDEVAWVAVDLEPYKSFERPVTLAEIKGEPGLKNMELLRISRLSVSKVRKKEFESVCRLGGLSFRLN
jgi:predicted RNA-binding protein with PUA-like domain